MVTETSLFIYFSDMKSSKISLAHHVALKTYSRIVLAARNRTITGVACKFNEVSTVSTKTMEAYTPEDVAITDSKILLTLGSRAVQLYIHIINDLQFNNALWYFDHTLNKRDGKAIKELREKGILFPTEDTRIHFVNPDMIRKGNKLLVAANTAMVTSVGKVDRSMIRPLNKKNITLNPMHLVDVG